MDCEDTVYQVGDLIPFVKVEYLSWEMAIIGDSGTIVPVREDIKGSMDVHANIDVVLRVIFSDSKNDIFYQGAVAYKFYEKYRAWLREPGRNKAYIETGNYSLKI